MNLSLVIRCATDPRLRYCLRSIDERIETVVVMNDPTHEIQMIAKNHGAKCVNVEAACDVADMQNIGVTTTSSDQVLLMDSDCIFMPGCISKIYAELERSRECIIRGNVHFKSQGGLSDIIARLRLWHDMDRAYTPLLAFNKDTVLSRMGGYFFDVNCSFVEDHEFDLRRRNAGVPLVYCENAVAEHDVTYFREDIRRARKYGRGFKGIGDTVGLKRMLIDTTRKASSIMHECGAPAALYYLTVWKPTFLVSYYGR